MEKVLVTDDDLDALLLAEKLLARSGFEVLTATDGRMALELIRSEHPRVVVLDLLMPGLHGFAVLQEVQADPALRGTQIVVTSSKAYPGDIKKAKELGAKAYLIKPYDPRELLRAIQLALENPSTS